MKAETERQLESKDPSIGAIPEIEMAGVAMIICMLLIAVCFAAPLLLELPEMMDGAVSAEPMTREVSAGAAVQPAVDGAPPEAARGVAPGVPTGATDALQRNSAGITARPAVTGR